MQSINFQKKPTKGEVRNMKNILVHSTARAAVALAIVFGSLTTFTHAADIGTANLQLPVAVQTGKQKVIGAVLARPVLAKGDVLTTVAGVNQFTATAMSTDLTVAAFVPVSTAIAGWTGDWKLAPASDNHYIVEFTSGPNTGLIKRVTAFSALATPSTTSCVVTVEGNLPTIDASTRFVVRKDHTLASLFGDQTSASASGITTANSAGSSDQFGIYHWLERYCSSRWCRSQSGPCLYGYRSSNEPDHHKKYLPQRRVSWGPVQDHCLCGQLLLGQPLSRHRYTG